MKILFLAAANSTHTVRWVNTLVERGHDIYLVYMPEHDDAERNIDQRVHKIVLPVSGNKGYYLNAWALKRVEKEVKPDVANVHYASGYGTLMRLAGLKNTVLSVWGSDVYMFPYKNAITMRIIIKNLKYANSIASTSKCMAEQVRKLINTNKKIYITPFGVDLKQFRYHPSDNNKEEIVIGNVKSLSEVYGISYLIHAIKILIDSLHTKKPEIVHKIKCYIYGDGEQKDELQNLINNLKLKKTIKLMGRISHDNVPKVLENMTVFCATSVQESFGVSVIEAEAMGLPVVVTNTVGFMEVVEAGKTAIVVNKKDPKQIADALEMLVLDIELRTRMGMAGRKRVEKLYDWSKNVSIMEEIYTINARK